MERLGHRRHRTVEPRLGGDHRTETGGVPGVRVAGRRGPRRPARTGTGLVTGGRPGARPLRAHLPGPAARRHLPALLRACRPGTQGRRRGRVDGLLRRHRTAVAGTAPQGPARPRLRRHLRSHPDRQHVRRAGPRDRPGTGRHMHLLPGSGLRAPDRQSPVRRRARRRGPAVAPPGPAAAPQGPLLPGQPVRPRCPGTPSAAQDVSPGGDTVGLPSGRHRALAARDQGQQLRRPAPGRRGRGGRRADRDCLR